MAELYHLKRRDFINIVLAVSGSVMAAVIGLPALGYLLYPATRVKSAEAWISLGLLESYPVGTPTLFSFTRTTVNGWEKTVNSFGASVVRSSLEHVTVYSNMCTHLSCRVKWAEQSQEFVCPCHDGHFNLAGQVTGGPPPSPLKEYETKVEEGVLYLLFMEG